MFKMAQVFVYGTLKSGQPNNYRMLDAANGKAKLLARSRTVDSYPLVIATQYNVPFLLNIPGKGHRVQGEIYSVDEKMLNFLDWFERCPHQYQRTLVKLEVDEWVGEGENNPKAGSIVEAFVYSTTTYKPEWLQNPTYENYNYKGDHGLEYIRREDRSTK
ncbi:gamma-glutamylaminecyclotransferase B-like [Xyrauchen texanus]|uniref:gamma-glutamylaminecyclotransferase B-like n=1 Tax=Xyrauchen texanus TaxID=154827 RepID=UPI0022421E23|nr:gamma-glutamylaminecyclotransferase B-like [Xyrauchen texanus]XP_051983055.1 gamma-glutamylaminecyclotransferase B-like [Xyrauchen texanus]XP_051983056.1 gamma-glutamylaminecyclotransferase B-like [Xyrauchen texanus]XP_051983057.1 gamma-glutamylaminecyclotransferase B-like [Xyrauchen texanus]XP_051983058.1 gamma-glutamylaminecyclotransferase B-like [Xyrauchen texanus]